MTDEPTTPGTVIKDRDGDLWVLLAGPDGKYAWYYASGLPRQQSASFEEIYGPVTPLFGEAKDQRIRQLEKYREELADALARSKAKELELLARIAELKADPMRMAEPTNVGAVVRDADGCLYLRHSSQPYCWLGFYDSAASLKWDELAAPQPFQNCVLTADDPEPPKASVVLDKNGIPWRHEWLPSGMIDCWWVGENDAQWKQLPFPVTLIHRGAEK
jgi:hypothetical protein